MSEHDPIGELKRSMDRQTKPKSGLLKRAMDKYTAPYRRSAKVIGVVAVTGLCAYSGWAADARHDELISTNIEVSAGDASIISFDAEFKDTRITAARIAGQGSIEQHTEVLGWEIPGTNSGMDIGLIVEKSLCMDDSTLEVSIDRNDRTIEINVPDPSVIRSCDSIDPMSVEIDNNAGIFSSLGEGIIESSRWADGVPIIGDLASNKDNLEDTLRNATMVIVAEHASDVCNQDTVGMAKDALKAAIAGYYTPGLEVAAQVYPEIENFSTQVLIGGRPYDEAMQPSDNLASGDDIYNQVGSQSNLDESLNQAVAALEATGFEYSNGNMGQCIVSDVIASERGPAPGGMK